MRQRALVAAVLSAAVAFSALAAPNVPPSEQAGRERERFTPSPLDRFMQPGPPAEPLIRYDCHDAATSRTKRRSRRGGAC
jgi:hypothetical protein